MSTFSPLDPAALARERSIVLALATDAVLIAAIAAAAVLANSLTMLAEALRATLLVGLEVVLLVLMRRIHRNRVHRFDYGTAKLEQFANLGIGTAMGLAGLWVGFGAIEAYRHPTEHPAFGLVFAAAVGAANLVQNGLALLVLWRAGRDGTSILMAGQIRSRLTKLLSSGLVLLALIVHAVAGPGRIGTLAEVLGAAFVAVVMIELAVAMWRKSLPSLLDRTLDEERQGAINRALVGHFHAYESLVSVRSRVVGETPWVEVTLGFAPERTMGAVQAALDAVRGEVEAMIPGAEVRVTPVSA